MTTDRTVTPLKQAIGEYSLNSDAMHVVEFRYDFYAPREGFSRKRAVLKSLTPERRDRELICADVFAAVRPCSAPDVRIDHETKNLLIRFIDGERFGKVRESSHRWTQAQRFDIGIMCAVDLMIDASDRHGGNAMVLARHIIPIDHEHTLGCVPRARPIMRWAWCGMNYGEREGMMRSASFRRGFESALCRIDKKAARIARLLNRQGNWRVTTASIRRWVENERVVAYGTTI